MNFLKDVAWFIMIFAGVLVYLGSLIPILEELIGVGVFMLLVEFHYVLQIKILLLNI